MHIRAVFKAPRLNLAKYRRKLHEQLTRALVESCQVWLTAAVGLPIWSGASVATFTPLASHVAFALAPTPVGGAPNRVAIGIANGSAEFEAGTGRPGLYTFTYSTTLPHLIVNEYHNANLFLGPNGPYFHLKNPGPYHFQKKAEQAFRSFVPTIELPGWGSILDVATIVVG